jgi:L-iditol 2-dehydrogenase
VRVAVYHSNHDLRLEDWPRPVVGRGEALLRVRASGICGSDVMEWYRLPKAPLVLGHEVAGDVEEVGEGVSGLEPGDRVVATHHVPCGACRYCRSDRHSACETLRATSFFPGGFSELVRLPAINVERGAFRLPGSVSYEEGSFVEPLACALRAQRIAGVGPGMCVAVLGSGISGILHLQLARARGAGPIVATDLSPKRLAAARRFGADAVLDARDDVPEGVRRANDGRLADVAIVCAAAPSAIDQGFRSVDRGGTVLLFAPSEPGTIYPLPLHDFWFNGTKVVSSYAGPPDDMLAALDLIASRRVDVASMVTHRLGLSEIGEGFRLVLEGRGSLKVIVDPQR